ncbi:hypothetical protein HJFPF1_03611 [Paramyrothecium foliicola]|nr:hypothetical protein HJFPF1_03611 [Paramyrothecium foliicola]
MAAENESPAREPSVRGRGRGGRGSRGGRGRGGGRGASSATVSKSATAKPGRGGTRRGRAKNFADSRVQAAYERQRDLKATYQAVAHALKPALQELAERSIDEALQNPDLYRQSDEHVAVTNELQHNLDKRLAEFDERLQCDLKLAQGTFDAERYVTEQEFQPLGSNNAATALPSQNGFDEIEEQFYEGQHNRLRILELLDSRDIPVDVRDDQYEYKVISDEHFDKEFGIFECYKDGHLVPYPSRVEGTGMWQKARDADAAVATVVTAAPTKGKGRGRGINKRRAQDQPEGQPTPKRSVRGVDDSQLIEPSPITPAPAKGLLASAAEVELHPDGTPADEESVPASPEPPNLVNGSFTAAQGRLQAKVLAREKSPPLPKNAAEPDEYGFRIYNQRPSMREKWVNSRVLAPRPFLFEDWEIGFRDSSNDSTKGHTRAKRGKYLDTPNSNGVHFDHWCNGYDYSATTVDDFDKKLVKRHGIHPTYGVFLSTSNNELEKPNHYVMPGKPIVYIANPSGRISHASRSFQKTMNHRLTVDAPWRKKMGASLRRFCKLAKIESEDVDVSEYLIPDEELRQQSLGTALKELEARPLVEDISSDIEDEKPIMQSAAQNEGGLTALSVLTYATAFVEAENASRPAPPTPKPVRYDAIRDVFTDSKPAAAPVQESNALGLNFLAELCNVETRLPGPAVLQDTRMNGYNVLDSDIRMAIPRDEPMPAPMNHAPPPGIHGGPSDYTRTLLPQQQQQQPLAQHQLQPTGPVYGPPGEMHHYLPPPPPPPPPPPMRGPDFGAHSLPGPPGPQMQEPGVYLQHGGGYDAHVTSGRPLDPAFHSRRPSGYAADPNYARPYWPQQQPTGPTQSPVSSIPPPQHFPPAPATHSRIPFAHTASAEPLPPLRPPRARNQPMQEEPVHDPGMRSASQGNIPAFYSHPPPGPGRSFHHSYPGPEPHAPLQPLVTERILPNPQQSGQAYMTSPQQGYPAQMLSPTFANPQLLPHQIGQSPPGTPHAPPSSIHRHRSTPSGSSDAGSNKYRKLQPAPVPAHRAWSSKPELKTIPYDHKETGGAAALPSSGPTQIRGWNVNQHRKRSKSVDNSHQTGSIAGKQPNFKNIRFAPPIVGLPPLYSREKPAQASASVQVLDRQHRPPGDALNNKPLTSASNCQPVIENNTLKHRLRPRKPKPAEPDVVIVGVRQSARRTKPSKKPGPKPCLAEKKTARSNTAGAGARVDQSSSRSVDCSSAGTAQNGSKASIPIEIPDEDISEKPGPLALH